MFWMKKAGVKIDEQLKKKVLQTKIPPSKNTGIFQSI